jgi:4-hydroxy-3-methylbut-2-enyl diphosphate reductase
VAELERRGVEVVNCIDDIESDTVIIRSHGIGPAEKDALDSAGVRIVDATCPYVLRAQKAAAKLAEEHGAVVVIGDPNHPEVEAIRAYAERANGIVYLVDAPESIPERIANDVGVVVQTTQNRDVFDAVLAAMKDLGIRVDVKDTICEATSQRQAAARALAAQVDAMVVIGGHNSSNTTRLYEICKSICPKTYHIETEEEVEEVDYKDCKAIGVTAGASTPERQIALVEAYLERL